MVRIRLRRVGRKKNPVYRIVVADVRSPRDGRFIETIGHYNPRQAEGGLEVKTERADKVFEQPTGLRIFIESTIAATAFGRPGVGA